VLYKFEIGKLTYQYTHKMLSDLFQDYFSDSTSSHSYTTRHASKNPPSPLYTKTLKTPKFIPRYTTTRIQQSFKYIDAKIWNDILQAIRQF